MGFTTLGLVLAAVTGLGQAPPSQPLQPFSPGEIIVAFKPDSDIAAKIAAAAARGEQPSAEINTYVDEVSKRLGLPLGAKVLGSGGTLVLTIRHEELPAVIATQLRRQAFVQVAEETPETPTAAAGIRVEFVAGSAEATRITSTRISPADIAELTKKLGELSGLPLDGVRTPSGALILRPSLRQLTLETVEQLLKQPNIRYAQPNYKQRLRQRMPGEQPQ